jgi:hypothetical protein
MVPSDRIFLNNSLYNSWSTARDQVYQKLAAAKAGTVWDRVRIESEVQDADDALFKLSARTVAKTVNFGTLRSGIRNKKPAMPVLVSGTACEGLPRPQQL